MRRLGSVAAESSSLLQDTTFTGLVKWVKFYFVNVDQLRERFDRFLGLEDDDGRPRARRERILRAASTLFVELGYKKANVAEVARMAGVTKPTVYAHYDSKAQLLLHAVVLEKRGYLERMRPALDERTEPRERLRLVVELSLTLAREMPLTARLIRGERDVIFALQELDEAKSLGDPTGARREAMRTGLYEELIEVVAPGRFSRREVRERAKVLGALTFCSGVLDEDEIRQGLSYERTAALLAQMLAAGVDAD